MQFRDLRRQQFRRYYQPTRILLGIVESRKTRTPNVITLCFSMTCSYKPAMMAVSVQRHSYSFDLFQTAPEFVLAVPGESLAQETLFCGVKSGREHDKVQECNLQLSASEVVAVPGLLAAIAKIELSVTGRMQTGDHLTVVGEVRRYAVNSSNRERNLLSVGPSHDGYEVLVAKGIHRIGVVDSFKAARGGNQSVEG
jgi:flavin reductase (DIM6/NTAB) family NADH-FMN oxidoreductase RutF